MTTVTSAGNNGVPEGTDSGAPQDDDPFGYLYRPAEGAPAQQGQQGQQPGVPRTSYNRPVEVGRTQYGQPGHRPQTQPRQQPEPGPQGQYQGGPPSHGELPTQQNRYAERSRPQPGEERPSGGRSKGAVIGAVAVVAAIAIGAGIALSSGDPGDTKAKGGQSSAPASPTASSAGPASASPTASATVAGPTTKDASQLQGQNAPLASAVKGAKSADGSYLTLQPGSSVTWKGDVPAAGTYKFLVRFNNAGADLKGTVNVNGKDRDGGLDFKNYAPGGDATQSWYSTYILPQLTAGPNTITVSAPAGGTVLVDQITVSPSG
ncbi:carbohydrate-binding protein [Kitasatospora indigofera]|uniref:carbohydrate-binding protein n=1 Tax=Kitasatospora indigofera TaxID=67307 RepID=UPI00368A6B6D